MDVTCSLSGKVFYFPVRHHSPACSFHLEKVMEAYQPDVILIEGPDNANDLIPDMTDETTQAPFCIYYSVALLLPVVATYYILQASNDLYLNGSVVFSMLITFAVIVIRGNKQMKNFSLESL